MEALRVNSKVSLKVAMMLIYILLHRVTSQEIQQMITRYVKWLIMKYKVGLCVISSQFDLKQHAVVWFLFLLNKVKIVFEVSFNSEV